MSLRIGSQCIIKRLCALRQLEWDGQYIMPEQRHIFTSLLVPNKDVKDLLISRGIKLMRVMICLIDLDFKS